MRRTLVFIVFLAVYFLWIWLSYKLSKKIQANVRRRPSFWISELTFLQSYAFLFGSIYLLSGVWIPKVMLLFLVAGQIPIIGGFGLWTLSSRLREKTLPAQGLAGAEVAMRPP